MFYTIYRITNKINNKFYIGKHQSVSPVDNYFGSGIAITNAIKLHGKDNFTKEILFTFSNNKEMDAKERELVTEELVNDPNCYNIGIGGEGGPHFLGKKHTAETKAKISANKVGKCSLSVEGAANISKANKGRKVSAETCKKLSDSAKLRKPQDDECKKRISESMKEYHKLKKYRGQSGDRSVS